MQLNSLCNNVTVNKPGINIYSRKMSVQMGAVNLTQMINFRRQHGV